MSGFSRGASGAFGKLETNGEPDFCIRHLGRNYKRRIELVFIHRNKGNDREESSCLLQQEVLPCKSAHVV